MREVELVDPEVFGNLRGSPVIKEFYSLPQILNVARQRLKTGVGFFHPHVGSFAINHEIQSTFKFRRQQNFSFNSSFHVLQRISNDDDKSVKAWQLLSQYRVHRLSVANWEAFLCLWHIKRFLYLCKDRVGQRINNCVFISVITTTSLTLSTKHS